MDENQDPEVTPRPLHDGLDDLDSERTPYIPRRKSSIGDRHGSSHIDISTVRVVNTTPKPLAIRKKPGLDMSGSVLRKSGPLRKLDEPKARTPDDRHTATPTHIPQRLPSNDRVSVSSTESKTGRKLLSKIMSAFLVNNNNSLAIAASTVARNSRDEQRPLPRLSGSTAFDIVSRNSSLASGVSANSSLVHYDPSNMVTKPSSPNPLRAPPRLLLPGPATPDIHPHSSALICQDETPHPPLAAALLTTSLDVSKFDRDSPASVWISIDVTCVVHYVENPASSPRSQAFGPPATDPGFVNKLRLEITPSKGCSIVRLLGSESRDYLLPGQTWSVVVQMVADPPLRRQQPAKAFSVQSRTSHAMMSQIHGMLSPSGPVQQPLVDINVTFEHALLPPCVQCIVSDRLTLERVGALNLKPRAPYLRHRRKNFVPPNPHQEMQEEREGVTVKLLDVLEAELRDECSIGNREALEVLEDFFDAFEPSKQTRQRVEDLSRYLQDRIRPMPHVPSISRTKKSRHGMELSRENLHLQDITNQHMIPHRPQDIPRPVPLFSPRKRPSTARLQHRSSRIGFLRPSSPTGAQVGSPRYYEDELDEASQIWKGMRDSSGSNEYQGSHGLQSERGPDGQGVVGAPWL